MKPNPIVVRPRQASALEKVWIENDRSAAIMREKIHAWAEEESERLAKGKVT